MVEANGVRVAHGRAFSELLPQTIGPHELQEALRHIGDAPYAMVLLNAFRRSGISDPRPTLTLFWNTDRLAWQLTAHCAVEAG